MKHGSGVTELSGKGRPWLLAAAGILLGSAGIVVVVQSSWGAGGAGETLLDRVARLASTGPLGGWSALLEGHVAGARGLKVLRIAESDLPVTLNPLNIRTMVERRSLELIHDGPYAVGETGEPAASLIDRTPDDNQPRFVDLEDGYQGEGWLTDAVFQNGEPVTVTDLEKTLAALEASAGDYRATGFFRGLVDRVEALEPDPQHHFRIVLQKRLTNLRHALTFKILPAGAFRNPNPATFARDRVYNRKPIGAGPFELVSDNLNQSGKASLSFRAHARYHKGRPKIDQVILVHIPSASDKLFQLRGGQIDVIVSLSKRDQVKARTYDAVIVPYPISNWWYLGFNCAQPLLKDPAIRRALARIVNRPALARKVGRVYQAGSLSERESLRLENNLPGTIADVGLIEGASAILVSGPFVPSSPYYNREVAHPVVDPAEAKRELLADPRITQRGELLYYRNAPLSLELRVDQSLTNATDIANQLVQDFRDVGIKVSYQALSTTEWESAISPLSGGGAEGIDLILGRWNFNYTDDISGIFRSDGPLNYYRYSNPEVDRLFDTFYYEADFTRRANMMKQVHKILAEDMPCVFLWQANEVAAFSMRVSGYAVHSFSFYVNLHNWDIEEDTRR